MTVQKVFDDHAAAYDGLRRKLVPCFDDFYAFALSAIPFGRNERIRVLDLGAGTGILSGMIAAAWPEAAITLADVAANMLGEARRRLDPYGGRIAFVTGDYLREFPPGSYDAIVSALSIHHLDSAQKWQLFCRCHAALADGGVLVNADQVKGASPEIEAGYRQWWLECIRAKGATESEIAGAFVRMKEDRMSTLNFQLAALEDAGFSEVDCSYRCGSFVVYSARKR